MKRSFLVSIIAIPATAVALFAAARPAVAGPHCHKVTAHIADALFTDGCPSPVGLCTAGTISGDGLVDGTFYNVVNNLAPSATPGVFSLDTTSTITTDHGQITLHGSAEFDPASAITVYLRSPSGTGQFAGATGRLFVNALVSPTNAQGDVTGEICLAE